MVETFPPSVVSKEVQGYIVGCVGVHSQHRSLWVVTHLPTGMSLMGNHRVFSRRSQAVDYATKLQDRFPDLHCKEQKSDWSMVGALINELYKEVTTANE